MKKLLSIAAVSLGLAFAPAHAAVIDFANEADTNGERGLTNGSAIAIDGFNLVLTSFDSAGDAAHNPYLDAGNAGLGVCQTGLDNDAQCITSSDDNVTNNEQIQIAFSSPIDILDTLFRAADHSVLTMGSIEVVTNLGSLTDDVSTLMATALANGILDDASYIQFNFVDTEFYVSSITVNDVPIPGAIPLLISGLAGLGFAGRRKKKTA